MAKKKKPENVFNIGVGVEKKGQLIGAKALKQSGKVINEPRDKARKAMLPGKRMSRTGKVYWETRVNRSDAPLKTV